MEKMLFCEFELLLPVFLELYHDVVAEKKTSTTKVKIMDMLEMSRKQVQKDIKNCRKKAYL